MKKTGFLSAENLRLLLIAIILAAMILLIPFYIKAQPIAVHSVDLSNKPLTKEHNDTIKDKE